MNPEFPFRPRIRTSFSAAILTLWMIAGVLSVRAQSTPAQPSSPQTVAPYIYAKFETSINTKKAKVGDELKAKIIRDLRLKDLDIPKGSILAGAVTAMQSRKDGNGDSSLSVKFDRVELKSGAVLPVQGLIVSIGEVSNGSGLGPYSAFGRGGIGSTPGLDPNVGTDKSASDDIPPGSSLPGVALGNHLDSNGASELRGVKTEIKFDTDTEIKVALFRRQ